MKAQRIKTQEGNFLVNIDDKYFFYASLDWVYSGLRVVDRSEWKWACNEWGNGFYIIQEMDMHESLYDLCGMIELQAIADYKEPVVALKKKQVEIYFNYKRLPYISRYDSNLKGIIKIKGVENVENNDKVLRSILQFVNGKRFKRRVSLSFYARGHKKEFINEKIESLKCNILRYIKNNQNPQLLSNT